MSSDQDDSTLSGRHPLPSREYRPGDEDDVFSSFGVGTGPATDSGGLGAASGATTAGQPHVGGVETHTAPVHSEDEEEGEDEEASPCVVIGPSNAGKTALLASLDQACSAPPDEDDRFQVALVGGKGTDRLAAAAIRTIMERDYSLLGDVDLTQYTASITVTEGKTFWRPAMRQSLHLVFRDGPGGVLFPSEKITDEVFKRYFEGMQVPLLEEIREARTLVLCIDSTEPRPDVVTQYMRNILAKAAKPKPLKPDLPPGYRFIQKVRQGYRRLRKLPPGPDAPSLRPERRLQADRFLLLLTKADQLLARKLDWDEEDSKIEPPSPADLALHLSPVETACELLDESNLMRILNALMPDARLAVGLTSAWGFDPYTGRPFMERDDPVALSVQDRSRRVLNWRPYGVREALVFIATGVAVGPIEQVQRSTLTGRLKRTKRELDVPPHFFGAAAAKEESFSDDDARARGPRRIQP